MPTIPLRVSQLTQTTTENPLPLLLHTPSGLALLDLQGTVHFPSPGISASATPPSVAPFSVSTSTLVGKLVFPLYDPDLNGPDDTKWMKRVYFYIGHNQRMSGEVKKLAKPFAVVQKVEGGYKDEQGDEDVVGDVDMEKAGVGIEDAKEQDELEIVDVVKYKVVFSTRPEPVTIGGEEV